MVNLFERVLVVALALQNVRGRVLTLAHFLRWRMKENSARTGTDVT